MSKRLWGFILLIALGFLKMPLEEKVDRHLVDSKLQEPIPDVGTWEQIGQVFIFASLGGLRSLAASISFLLGGTAWEQTDWGNVDSWMRITVLLEPREASYWEIYSWHMAYNAASYYIHEGKVSFGDVPVSQNPMAKALFDKYVRHGTGILEESLRYLPNNPRLLEALARTYRDRMSMAVPPEEQTEIHRKAANAYLAAYKNGGMEFCGRMGAYELVKLPDRASWEKAYQILKYEYDIGHGVPSVVRDLPILEERLNVPKAQRINPKAPVPERPRKPGLQRQLSPK